MPSTRAGAIFCLASGAAFGSMAIFGKLSYEEGVSVGTLLAVRFTIGAALFWALVFAQRSVRSARALSRRDMGIGLGLGAIGYSAQAGLYFLALERIDASVLSLLLYTFPALVTVAAIALGRERFSARRFAALALTSAGLVLVLAGAGTGTFNAAGAALGLGAACVYTVYILSSQGIASRVSPYLLSALVCTGGALTLSIATTLLGDLHPAAVTAKGWLWLGGIALISTVAAISLFFAGLRRVGPSTASILATVEPVVTVVLAFLVFGERLGAVQVVGGLFVLASVVVLQARPPARRRAADRSALVAELG
jgi:drug/metabolite transporter (DMT)-like permease